MKKIEFEKMTWKEIQVAVKESQGIAILPVGAVEEHGPHNPVGTDSIETYEIGLRVAAHNTDSGPTAGVVWKLPFADGFPGHDRNPPRSVEKLCP